MNGSLRFRGSLTALLTLAGVSIGLGNVWRFPYMMGQYGGSAFLVIYLLMMLLVAIPALAAEWAVARHTRLGTLGSFKQALGPVFGGVIGVLLVFGIFMADAYYMVVIGNITFASAFSVMAGFSMDTAEVYTDLLGDGLLQYGFAVVVLAWGALVVWRGLHAGIEAVSRLFVPLFGLVMLYLVVFTLNLDTAADRLLVFLAPDLSKVDASVAFAALGQACFSIGIGGTLMLVYGSYLSDDESLLKKSILTGLSDTGAALLAAAFVVPATLVFGISMASGPTLIFSTLPELFSQLPGGRLAGSLFLVALTMMAFLSTVAGLMVCLRALQHLWGQRAGTGTLLMLLVVIEAGLMLPLALNPEWIGLLDLVFGSGFLVFGSAMTVIGLAWGFGPEVVREQFGGSRLTPLLTVWLRFVVPLALLLVLGLYIVEQLA